MPLFRELAKNMAPMTNADESPTNRLTLFPIYLSLFVVSTLCLKPGSHMSLMTGESLSVTIQGENSQRILLMSSQKQWSSPMSATYENQA